MNPLVLAALFVIGVGAGYKVIRQVPSLLHTPLMSGMNALSGVTALGALVATATAVRTGSQALGAFAVVLGMTNVVGGFLVTDRILRMFKSEDACATREPNQ